MGGGKGSEIGGRRDQADIDSVSIHLTAHGLQAEQLMSAYAYADFDVKSLRYHLTEEGPYYSFECEKVLFRPSIFSNEYNATLENENARQKISTMYWTGHIKPSRDASVALLQVVYDDQFNVGIFMEYKRFSEFMRMAKVKILRPEILLQCSLSHKDLREQGQLVRTEDPPISRLFSGAVIQWHGVRFTFSS